MNPSVSQPQFPTLPLVSSASRAQDTDAAITRELYTWANLVTAIRLAGALGLFAVGWQDGRLRWALYGLLVYWVGDLLDGWLARALRQETLLGAQIDIGRKIRQAEASGPESIGELQSMIWQWWAEWWA